VDGNHFKENGILRILAILFPYGKCGEMDPNDEKFIVAKLLLQYGFIKVNYGFIKFIL
jgi:hypothetical protein